MKLPPLPTGGLFDESVMVWTAEQMCEYATAAIEANRASVIEAYKASLKPVAYMSPEWVKGKHWPDDCFTLPEQSIPEDWVPIYRLDDQP